MHVDVTEQECAGVGRALAQEFLRCGDSVIICSRDSERLLPYWCCVMPQHCTP